MRVVLLAKLGVGEGGAVVCVEAFGQPAGHDSTDTEIFAGSGVVDPAKAMISEGGECG